MNHRWPPKHEEIVVTAQDSRDGNEHHLRQCIACGIFKIMVMPAVTFDLWIEWITASGTEWEGAGEPPCIPKGVVGGLWT